MARHDSDPDTGGPRSATRMTLLTRLLSRRGDPVLVLDETGMALTGSAPGLDLLPRATKIAADRPWSELRAACPDAPEALRLTLHMADQRLAAHLSRLDTTGGKTLYLLEPRAERVNRVNLFATIAHDLKTELQGIMAASDLLATAPTTEAPALRDTILRAARIALEQVDQCLQLARMDHGEAHQQATLLAPDQIFRDTTERLRPLAAANGNRLHYQGEVRPTQVIGQTRLVNPILLNLLGNAIKFTHNGDIRISLHGAPLPGERRRFTLEVQDNGAGIDAGDRARFLNLFDTGSEDGAAAKGTGIGTFVVREAVTAMEGELSFRDTPGGGTTFTASFILPLPQTLPDDPHTLPRPEDTAPDLLAGRRILIIEDNATVGALLRSTLTTAGARVDLAATGRAGLAALRGSDHDIALIDMNLPDLDGISLVSHLPAPQDRAATPRLVGLSANTSGDWDAACRAVGITELLRKPMPPAELRRRLAGLLATPPVPAPRPAAPLGEAHRHLHEEMGADMTRRYVTGALEEAESLVGRIEQAGLTPEGRADLHAALGSAGMTGLTQIEQGFRRLQAITKVCPENSDAVRISLKILRDAVTTTRNCALGGENAGIQE
ncbi:hybrid sensor histidine kinase/response regulator [Pseudooceanicola aestuarii]|uniref:ATP-binding response regulator n=1 Tax=Pseudooceanicola aestuarii TaxID=2697319 RepID=UPI0013D689E5|nr:hybrid sensor histidine kinase/response regulator [Pseudooceanicola aestuarii]